VSFDSKVSFTNLTHGSIIERQGRMQQHRVIEKYLKKKSNGCDHMHKKWGFDHVQDLENATIDIQQSERQVNREILNNQHPEGQT
jgi:hypothetical protein